MENVENVIENLQNTINQLLDSKPFLKRLLVLVGTLIVILLCTFAFSMIANTRHASAAARPTAVTYQSVRVMPGDSLWSIASTYHGTKDTAIFVNDLKQLNNMSADQIKAGSYILVPVTSVL